MFTISFESMGQLNSAMWKFKKLTPRQAWDLVWAFGSGENEGTGETYCTLPLGMFILSASQCEDGCSISVDINEDYK